LISQKKKKLFKRAERDSLENKRGEKKLSVVYIQHNKKYVLSANEIHLTRGVPLKCFLPSVLLKKIKCG
jgi:hypothetical protein